MRQKLDRKNRVKKRRVVRRIYGMKHSWKGHKDRNRHKNRIKKRSGQARLIYVKNINRNIPTTWRWALVELKRSCSLGSVSKPFNRKQPMLANVMMVMMKTMTVMTKPKIVGKKRISRRRMTIKEQLSWKCRRLEQALASDITLRQAWCICRKVSRRLRDLHLSFDVLTSLSYCRLLRSTCRALSPFDWWRLCRAGPQN